MIELIEGLNEKPPSKDEDSQRVCRHIRDNRTDYGDLYWLSIRGGRTIKGLVLHSDFGYPDLR
jgi:hypothetical protein